MAGGRAPDDYRVFFAEVFAALDESPRTIKVKVSGEGLVIDLVDGNPVFAVEGALAKADFRNRWLAEHPVPTRLGRTAVFTFVPTTGNRVKVRIK